MFVSINIKVPGKKLTIGKNLMFLIKIWSLGILKKYNLIKSTIWRKKKLTGSTIAEKNFDKRQFGEKYNLAKKN